MSEAIEEDAAHYLFIVSRSIIGQIHKRLVVVLYLIVERHLANIYLMFQTTIQIGSLLIMHRHMPSLERFGVFEETGPEHLDILHPQGRYQRHFLVQFVVAMTVQESLHDEFLCHHIVCTQHIATRHQMEDRRKLRVLFQLSGMVDKALILLCPRLMIACMFQQ